jgi:hypothetical protein
MKRRARAPEMEATLRATWGRWTAIVELFARRRPARLRVDPRAYVALHGELIATCQALAVSGDESKRPFLRELEELVQPFLTTRVLAKTDREVLFDLLFRCRDIERMLRGATWTMAASRWVAPVFLSIVLGLVAFILIWITWGSWIPLWYRMRDWSDVVWITIKRSNDISWLIFLGVAVILTSIAILSRPARS